MAAPAAFAPPSAALLAGSAAVAMLAAALRRPPLGRPDLVTGGGAAAVLSLGVDVGYPGQRGLVLLWEPFELAALLVLTARVIRHGSARQAAVVGPALALAAVLLPLRFTLRMPTGAPLASVTGTALAIFPVACAVGVGLYLRARDGRRARAVQRARHEQRLEVARDLHDFVAHEVTGMLLEVQAARVGAYDEEQNRELLGRLEEAGRRALESVDRSVQALREPGDAATRVHGLADLSELVGRFTVGGRIEGRLDLPPQSAGSAPREIEDAAYRLVLEALTNIRRHAPGARHLEVVVRFVGGGLGVTVTNGGRRPGRITALPRRRHTGGTGLAALAERIEALGGRLTAGPHEGGWRVSGVLPLSS
ncbi:two-component sensor histidine kinase [Kitasatospora acidiphila]|uniref:histidine kinase n=1 Tax=Kitasatospora acidiphila TaxID=2567942 RepID=A0A540WEZ9_9ACTN|nr:two-component sensor histidine kinase [Kitasatospora acidiphila]